MSTNDQQPPSNPPFDPSSTVPFGRPEPTPPQGQAPQTPSSPWQAGAQPYPTPPQAQPQPGAGQPYPGPGQASVPAGGPAAQPYAGQPYPGQPYPGQSGPAQSGPAQPGPGQPFPGQPNPGQPYSPPPGGPVSPGSSGNKNLLWIIGGGVALLLVIALIVVFVVIRPGAHRNGGGAPTGGGEVKASTGESAVQGFLEALAAGDAATALKYAESTPTDTSLLTNEVLAASNATAPITDIKVSKASSKYLPVSASYMLGDELETADFSVSDSSGSWKLREVTREISLYGMNGAPLTLNGAAVTGEKLVVFPGTYTLAASNSMYQVGGGSFTVASPSDYHSPQFALSVSSSGLTALRNAAQVHLTSCLKQTSLAPKGCGFAIRAAGTGATRAKWTISTGKNAMRNASFRLDYQDPTQAKAYTTVIVRMKGYNKAGKYVGYGSSSISTVHADLSGKTVTVTFD